MPELSPRPTAGRLEGRRILITGAASGIGAAAARRFVREGARIAILDLQAEPLRRLAEETGAADFVVDLCDPAATRAAVDQAAERLGGLDGLVANAGVSVSKPFAETELADWRRAIDGNATSIYLTCHAALPHLQAAERATIVNLGSAVGLQPLAGRAAYAASKAAVHAFTKVLAMELAPKIRANVIAPGAVDTPLVHGTFRDPQALERIAARYALQRFAQPEEIVEALLFLTSFESAFVTGATLAVDGGRTYY